MVARDWQAVNKKQVDKAALSDRFIHKGTCGCGFTIHTFRRPGEQLEGRIRPCYNHDRADRAHCAHIHYLNNVGVEVAIAIRLSKILWEAIDKETNDKPKLWGQWIRITYIGSESTQFGHARKIYLVEVDKGSITENFEAIDTHATKHLKPRKPKAIKRPAGKGR